MTYEHLNSADRLPPVGCELIVAIGGGLLLRCERTSHLQHKGGEIEYRSVATGALYHGRWPWTYP